MKNHYSILIIAILLPACQPLPLSTASAGEAENTKLFRCTLLKQCDLLLGTLGKEHVSEFTHSYAVRALCVTYDLTGEKKYLDEAKAWVDRIVEAQGKMTPKGIFYMGYGRKPGEKEGQWYIADGGSIGMGVLAVAVRCDDPKEKERYLNSVRAFAKVVMDRYVGENGGIANGGWNQFDGEWWCSTGTFGSLAFLLYDETGDEKYLKVGLGAIDWLNRLDFRKIKHFGFKEFAPTIYFYCLETYSAGLPHLEPGTQRRKLALEKLSEALVWLSENQRSQGGLGTGDWGSYEKGWGMKLGGMPFHMLVMAEEGEFEADKVRRLADDELRDLCDLLMKDGKPGAYQLRVFTMLSLAERLAPGGVYRAGKP